MKTSHTITTRVELTLRERRKFNKLTAQDWQEEWNNRAGAYGLLHGRFDREILVLETATKSDAANVVQALKEYLTEKIK